MKNIRVFLSENFQFLEVKFSIYLNRQVFVMNIFRKGKAFFFCFLFFFSLRDALLRICKVLPLFKKKTTTFCRNYLCT